MKTAGAGGQEGFFQAWKLSWGLNKYEVAGEMVTNKKTKDKKGLCTVQDT